VISCPGVLQSEFARHRREKGCRHGEESQGVKILCSDPATAEKHTSSSTEGAEPAMEVRREAREYRGSHCKSLLGAHRVRSATRRTGTRGRLPG
jgi:hypothetical protein